MNLLLENRKVYEENNNHTGVIYIAYESGIYTGFAQQKPW